jgi:hypothetical protein
MLVDTVLSVAGPCVLEHGRNVVVPLPLVARVVEREASTPILESDVIYDIEMTS